MSVPTPAAPISPPDVVVLERTEQDLRHRWRDPEARVHAIHSRTTVKYALRRDGRVALWATVANHHRGKPSRTSTKGFSRWATDVVDHIVAAPGQPWRVSQFRTGQARFTTGWRRTVVFAEALAYVPSTLTERARDLLPEPPSVWSYYPLMAHYLPRASPRRFDRPDQRVLAVPAEVRRAFVGTDDVSELTRRLFGVSRYRRDLAKAVATADLATVAFAHQIRGLVDVDTLVRMMRDAPRVEGVTQEFLANVRGHLRGLDEQSRRNLMRCDTLPEAKALARDIARMPPAPAGTLGRVRTWKELHDRTVDHLLLHAEAFTATGRPRPPVRLSAQVESWVGAIGDGLSIEVARDESTLWEWVSKMRHCIASYGKSMRSGESVLGAVRLHGVLVANFEVEVKHHGVDASSQMCLTQVLGHRNTLVAETVRTRVLEHLAARGVTVPQEYWGARVVPGHVEAA